jgi:hypothetical protein
MSMRTIFFSRFSSGSTLKALVALPNLIAILMFISVTAVRRPHFQKVYAHAATQHWVVDVYRLYAAFVYNALGGPVQFYSNPAVGTNVAKTYLYVTQAIMGDVVLVRNAFLSSRC